MNILNRARRVSSLMLRAFISCTFGILVSTASAWTTSDATTIFNSYNNAFYVGNGGNAYYKANTGGGRSGFWTQANIIEMAEDAYDRTGSTGTRDQITALCNGFLSYHGMEWSENTFNDDVMWACIAFSRAYLITGNTTFRDRAKANFDMCWNRAWSTDLGGGLWWTTSNGSKNACVNGPGSIAASYIYQITGNSAYLTKAQQIFDWQRSTIFNQTTGAVADNITASGNINWGTLSYNQGTFVGAGNFLYSYTGNRQYYEDAWLAAKYTRDHKCNSEGRFLISGTSNQDGAGFSGIAIRWIARFAKDQRVWAYFYPWLKYNANLAWDVRRSDNLSWNKWNATTESGTRYSWECFPSVTAMQVVPAANPSPVFMIVNKNSGKSVDLIDGNAANGSVINQWSSNDSNKDQQWAFVPSEDGNHFLIVSRATGYDSGRVLCVDGNSTASGAQIYLWDYNGHPGQQWDLIHVSDGWYKIRNVNSGLVLDVSNSSTADGAKLQQWTDNGTNAQRFRLHPVDDYFIKASTGKYICIEGASGANGQDIIQYHYQDNPWFKWHFYNTSEGYERAASRFELSRVISIENRSTATSAYAQFWDYNPSYDDQKLHIRPLTNGRFKLYFKHTGMSWDIPSGNAGNNIPLEQYPDNGNVWQQFELERTPMP